MWSNARMAKCQKWSNTKKGQMPKWSNAKMAKPKWSNAKWSNANGHMPKWKFSNTDLLRYQTGLLDTHHHVCKRPRNAPETFEKRPRNIPENVPETCQSKMKGFNMTRHRMKSFKKEEFKWKISKRKVST